MKSTAARAAAVMMAALLVGSSATAATAAAGEQVRPSTVTAGEQGSVGASAAATMTSKWKPKPAKGFHVVKELPRKALTGLSPAKGELWLATKADHGVQLDHLRAGRWTTQTVPVDDGVGRSPIVLTGTSRDDVWLAAGLSLRRYDGRRWTTVALPNFDSGGQPVYMNTVESPRRGVLYAALSSNGWNGSSRVFRYAKGRWTDLGAPDDAIEVVVTQMKVVDGVLLTRTISRFNSQGFVSYVDGTWTGLYSNWFDDGVVMNIGGWYPRSDNNHLLLGGGGSWKNDPMCKQWIGAQSLIDCTSTRVTSASAQLKNGTIVLVEDDHFRFKDPWEHFSQRPPSGHVEGRGFSLRHPDGRETPLAGDSGNTTPLIVAEAHRNAAWAVTAMDTGIYLQRYEG